MKRVQITAVVVLLLCYTQASFAQNVRNLPLEEAISLGLANSKQLKIARSKKNESAEFTKEMKDHYLPDLAVSGQAMGLNQPSLTIQPNLAASLGGSGSGQPLSPPQYVLFGQASLKMPLFSGFKIKNTVRAASFVETASGLDVEAQKSAVIFNLMAAYVTLYKAQAAVEVVQKSLNQANQRVVDFSRLEENGLLATNDLLKAKLQASSASLALLDAQNNKGVANYNVNLLLGLDEEQILQADSLNSKNLPELTSLAEFRNLAITERNDLLAAEQRQFASAAQIKSAKADYWPSIGLTGGYFAANIDQMLTATNVLNVGVGVTFNLSNYYKAGSKIHQAQAKYEQATLGFNQLQDHVKSEVYTAFSNYQESMKRIGVLEDAHLQAAENYRITKNKHQNNLATTTDLLDANLAQFQAELNLKYARIDTFLAYCKLLEVSGQLEENTATNLLAR